MFASIYTSLTCIVCGPPRYSEIRINISQAFNGIGTVIAPVLGSYVFFNNLDDNAALANVQWVYLSIAVFVLILACLFYISKIPEITDAGMFMFHGSISFY
jgi:FHS family L-fucose permease-like MFS transporter